MCGIAAIVNFKRQLSQESARIEHMVQSVKHRGPDADQIVVKKNALLGHTRLAIIDVEKGCQPMSKVVDGVEYVIVYNGMLYNYEELRKDLLKEGYTFATDSDTEVLLTAYIAWKEECLSRFNGIFAFVIYTDNDVFVARDQMGVKPLYYVLKADGEFLFSSEIKAFFKEGSIRPTLTREKFTKLIALGPSLMPGETVYKNVKSLMPGHYLKIRSGRFQLEKYYTLEAKPHTDDFEATKQRVHELVTKAITRQCRSDVPIGSMLSGGLDSSIVSLIASRSIPDLPTFSLDYEGNHEYFQSSSYQTSEDEPYIKEMIKACESKHAFHVIKQEMLVNYLQGAMKARDMPHMADIDSSLLWFCEQIRPQVRVILSGECADEIFGGYPWFYREDLISMDTFPWLKSLPLKIGLVNDKWKKFDYYGVRKEAYEHALKEVTYLDSDSVEDKIARKMTYLCKDYFMQTLLSRQDAMASAVGLEGRVPFADVEMIDYVYNIPWSMKYYQGKEKGILREAFAAELPEMICNRKKNPYPKTHHPAYTQMIVEKLNNTLSCDTVLKYLFDERALRELIETGGNSFDQPWFGQLMKGPQLLAYLYQLELWFEEYRVNVDF